MTEPQADLFGVYLRGMRKRAGLSQRSLAAASRRNFTYISKIESGAQGPGSDASLLMFARALDLDPDELFWMAGKLPPDFRDLMMEAGPGHWKSLRRRFARNADG